MCSAIDPHKISFINLLSQFELPGISLITQAVLHSRKEDHIEALEDVGNVGQIARHKDLVHPHVVEKFICVV